MEPRLGPERCFRWAATMLALCTILLISLVPPARSSQDKPSDGHDDMSMPMDQSMPMDHSMHMDHVDPAKALRDKKESEFNHHLSGFFLILAGLFILGEIVWKNRFAVTRYAWALCFLLSGIFLMVFSDTELWPFGPKPWFHGVITNPEVIQHKVFAIVLLALGCIELARARDRLKAKWMAWAFPVVAASGSVLLLFHSHGAGGHTPEHMAIMAHIQTEHLSFAITGFGIALASGLAEIRSRWQTIFTRIWPTLLIVLGVLLMFYTE